MSKVNIPTTSIEANNIDELTSSDGNGVLDLLVSSLVKLLRTEFDADRIRGTDYSNAYIRLLEASLQSSIGYALDKAKLPLELKRLDAEVNKTIADTALTVKQGALVEVQATKEAAQIELIERDIALKEQQLDLQLKELELRAAELELRKQQILATAKDVALKEKQLDLAAKELELKEWELKNIKPAELASVQSQAELYGQKVLTEKAQTDGTIAKPNSVIDRNNKLIEAQTKGYETDAKQKYLKLMLDTWSVRHNSDPDGNGANQYNELWDRNIGETVNHVAKSIGLEYTNP